MSVSSSVWSLQFPTAWAYLLHLYEKLWRGEGWEPGWLSYICIQCLKAMRKEHLPLQPDSSTTNNLGEGYSHLYIQKWVRDEGNRSSRECTSAKKKTVRIPGICSARSWAHIRKKRAPVTYYFLLVIFLTRFEVILILVREEDGGIHNKPSGRRFRGWFVTIHG